MADIKYMQSTKESSTLLTVNWEDRWMDYVFHEDRLYLIRSGGYIRDKRRAKETVEELESYFNRATLWVNQQVYSTDYQEWITFRPDRWQQFFCQKHKGYTTIEIRSYSIEHTPAPIRTSWVAHFAPGYDPSEFQAAPMVVESIKELSFP